METQNQIEFADPNKTVGTVMNNQPASQPLETQPLAAQPAGESAVAQTQIKYAGFWIRWVANFIDGLVLIIPNIIAGLIIKFVNFGAVQSVLTSISGLLVSWVYFILMTNKYQATLGKKAVGIKVLSDKSENLTLGQVILRETIGKLISMVILFIGYIMAGFTKRKQALHDKIASTVVVYKDPNKKLGGWAIFAIVLACILPFIAIIGILASIVLVSLNSARNKAADAGIKATINSIIPDALIYADTNSTYKGYKIKAGPSPMACSGEPVVNISADGKQMAIFMKSCKDAKKYFCGNPESGLVTETAEVDEAYVESGASVCNSSDVPSAPSDTTSSTKNPGTSTAGQINLVNTFSDSALGYEIKYPEDWVQQKETDKETGVTTITFLPNEASPFVNVLVQNVEVQQTISLVALNTFIKSVQGELVKSKGKVYDEKEFVYNFANGTTSAGKAFKAEYEDNGTNIKQWIVTVPNGKKLYWLSYISDIDQYDTNYNIALAMLDSWKISK